MRLAEFPSFFLLSLLRAVCVFFRVYIFGAGAKILWWMMMARCARGAAVCVCTREYIALYYNEYKL